MTRAGDDRGGGLTVERGEVEPAAGASVPPPRVRAAGELDAATAPRLLEALSAAVTDGGDGAIVVADLEDVTFCDSRGLSVLVTATRSAARAGASLRLVAGPDAALARLLERSGMTGLLPLHPDVASALRAEVASPIEQEVAPDPG